jgi:hypothetical protein
MSDQNNDFGDEDLLASQALSSSACQLSMLDENLTLTSSMTLNSPIEGHGMGMGMGNMPGGNMDCAMDYKALGETASVGNLSDVELSQEIQNIMHPDAHNNEEDHQVKRVAFEPIH